jgi:hypothetical protein
MTSPIALARNEKADVQIQMPAESETSTQQTGAITRNAPFSEVRPLIEASRPLRRPNRHRPTNVLPVDLSAALEIAMSTPSLQELTDLAKQNPPPATFFDDDTERPW